MRWSPTFAQEAVLTVIGAVAAAFVVGVSIGTGLTMLVTRH